MPVAVAVGLHDVVVFVQLVHAVAVEDGDVANDAVGDGDEGDVATGLAIAIAADAEGLDSAKYLYATSAAPPGCRLCLIVVAPPASSLSSRARPSASRQKLDRRQPEPPKPRHPCMIYSTRFSSSCGLMVEVGLFQYLSRPHADTSCAFAVAFAFAA